MRRLRSGAGVMVVAGALLLTACGSGTPAKSGSPAASSGAAVSTTHITISNFMFHPMAITVSPGATISVTNTDPVTHTLTATGGQFNTGDVNQNQTKTITAPMKPGTYHYICNIHQYMMGTITVK
jgi:plastocyanin